MDSVHSELDELDASGTKVWVGKDYCNFIYKDFVDLDKPFAGTVRSKFHAHFALRFFFVFHICPP